MEKNLGHATAYGYAKSKGYSGTEDEFAQLMADYASVGQSAAQSAEQAAASATSASGSAATASQAAQTATSKAYEAVTAAGTATTKASEANQSASTASAAATSASTSAQTATAKAGTATAKADEAAASEAAALSAKTDAESARDAAAQSASEAAESARTLTIDTTLTQAGQAADAKAVGDLKNAITETFSGVTWTDGYISYPNGSITSSSNYQYSSPIDIGCGRIAVTLTDDTSVAVLAKFDAVANRYTALLAGDGTAYHKQYTYDVTEPGQYVISYRKPNGISDISLAVLPENVSVLRDTLDDRTLYIDEMPFESIEGSFVKLDGTYANSALYAHTYPLYLLPGDYVIAAYVTSGVSIVALSDKDGNNRTCVIESNPLVSHYSLHVTTAGYYIVSYRIAEGLVINKQYNVKDRIALVDDKLDDNALVALNRYKSDLITPNFSIKAFKTLNYTDGTTDKYAYVLWNDEVNDAFYMSDSIYSEKHKIFDWNSVIAGDYDSSYYQALILPNGDILFVFQTQFVSPSDSTAEGSYRQNPLICRASNGFRLEVIDFGSGVKPTGWLQNVGAIYSYAHNRVFIAEYTRANEKYARIWAVDMPVTTVSNWHIVLEKEIPTPYQTGFKHFHSCQQDPYTGILYFSSGDNDLSSAVWYSTDGGDTLVQLDDYNAGKYRMLNMAFTKEYVYWASDQWSPNHFLWRIERNENTGILDATTLTKLLTFDDERVNDISRIATYTTVYIPAYNCLLILDRDDGANHPKIPVRVYDIPSGNLYTVAELLPIASGAMAGFRNVAVTCYTKSNEVACSFDKKLLNNNKILGNNSTNRINNLIIRLYKSDNAIQKVVTPLSWTDGYITNNGAIISSDRYKYSSPFDVEEGRISVELTDDSNVAVFSSYDEQSGTYTPLVFGVGTGVHKVYEYNVTNPGKYVISYRTPNGIGDIKVIEKDADFNIEFDTVY